MNNVSINLQQAYCLLDEVNSAIKEIDQTIKEGNRKSETLSQYNSFINQRMGLIGYIREKLNEEGKGTTQ